MSNPNRRDGPPRTATGERRLSPEERRRVVRAALLRPMGLLVVVIGGIAFALTLTWWVVALTIATYAALASLAARDPLFWAHVLEGREYRVETRRAPSENLLPERRVRRLPPGETRRKMEEALELHRRTMVAVEEADDATKAVLAGAVPKLHDVVARLLDVAERREKVARALRDFENRAGVPQREDRNTDRTGLENELRAADAEISRTIEELQPLRKRVVRVSVESENAARNAAARLSADLDEISLRLDALRSAASPPPRSDDR